jgi:hypothetical protein
MKQNPIDLNIKLISKGQESVLCPDLQRSSSGTLVGQQESEIRWHAHNHRLYSYTTKILPRSKRKQNKPFQTNKSKFSVPKMLKMILFNRKKSKS